MSIQKVPRKLRHTKVWHTFSDHGDILRRKDDALFLAFQNNATSASPIVPNSYSQDKSDGKGEGPPTRQLKPRIKRKPPPLINEDCFEKQIVQVVGECPGALAGVQNDPSQTRSTSAESKGHLTSEPLSLNEASAAINTKAMMSTKNAQPTATTPRPSKYLADSQDTMVGDCDQELLTIGKSMPAPLTRPRPLCINKKTSHPVRPSSSTKLPDSRQNNLRKVSSSYSLKTASCQTSEKPLHTVRRPTLPRRDSTTCVGPRTSTAMPTTNAATQAAQEVQHLQPRRSPMRRTITLRSDVFCFGKSTSVATDKTHTHNDEHVPVYVKVSAEVLQSLERPPQLQLRRPPFQRTTSFRDGFNERPPLGDVLTTDIASVPRTTSTADRSSAEIPLHCRPPLRRELTIRPSADLGMAHTDDFGHREASTTELERLLESSACESETDSDFEFPLRPGIVSVLMEPDKSFCNEENEEPENAARTSLGTWILDDLFDAPLAREELEMIGRSAPIVAQYQEKRKNARYMPKVPSPMNPIRDGTHCHAWTSVLHEKEGKCLKHKLSKYGFWYLSDYLKLLRSKSR